MLALRLRAACGLLVVRGLICTSAATAAPKPEADLIVRTYNLVELPASDLHAAQRTARSIFEKAGVMIAGWRDCQSRDRVSTTFADDCAEGIRPNEVVVRIVRTPSSWSNQWALGFSYVEPHSTTSWLSTVFADQIAATARWSHLDPGTLLGRTVAHELGHLLLASTSHSAKGLMRANWRDASLRHHVWTDWMFSRNEASQIRADVIARSRTSGEPLAELRRAPSPAPGLFVSKNPSHGR